MSPRLRAFARLLAGGFLACLSSALAAAPARIAIVPFNQQIHAADPRLALAVRDELVARLSLDWDTQVLSRSTGLALLVEDQLASARHVDLAPRAPVGAGADHVVLGNFNLDQSRRALQLTLGVIAPGEEPRTVLVETIPFARPEPGAIAEAVARLLAERLPLRPRASASDPTSPAGRTFALLPPRVYGAPDALADSLRERLRSVFELGLREAAEAPALVERARLDELLRERRIARSEGLNENLAGALARLSGADEMVVPALHHDPRDATAPWRLRLLTIDARTGAITRVSRGEAASPDRLASLARRLAAALPGSPRLPVDLGPDDEVSRRRESALYARWAGLSAWSEASAHAEFGAAVRLELAEAALHLDPARSPAALRELAQNLARQLFPVPPVLVPYENFHGTPPPPALRRAGLELISRILAPVIADGPAAERTTARHAELHAHILAGDSDTVLLRAPEPGLDPAARAGLLVQAHLLRGDTASAAALEHALSKTLPEHCELRALLAASRGDRLAEFTWLMRRADSRDPRPFGHDGWSQRTLLLANDALPAAERIRLVDQRATRWGRAADVAQYTLIRARAELGHPDPGYAALERLRPKFDRNGLGPGDLEKIRAEIDRLLAARPASDPAADAAVRYADVRPPPTGSRVYIQPLGDLSPAILARAAEKIGWFLGSPPTVLPALPLPRHAEVFYPDVSEIHIGQLHRLVAHGYPIPADALQVAFVLREEIVTKRSHWIYAQAHESGLHYVSYYRWARSSRGLREEQIGDAVAKSILAGLQIPWRRLLRDQLPALIGSTNWPNHAGTLQHSRGSAMDVVNAPFALCPDTRRLYAAVDFPRLEELLAERRLPENLRPNFPPPPPGHLRWLEAAGAAP
mgnify:CR=1 FL=1